ncbi:MAG: DUF3179 domain-containing protein [bacterium]|nr:DUF3179 domain-containing protein [bacterium]
MKFVLGAKLGIRVFAICALLAVASVVGAGDAGEELLGTWSVTTLLGDQEMQATMTLERDDLGGLNGVWVSRGMQMDLRNIAVDGNRISFDREIPGGTLIHFEGELDGDAFEGTWRGPFGDARSIGLRGDAPTSGTESDTIPDLHDRPIVEEDGRTKLWAAEDDEGNVEWFDMTGAEIDPYRFQFGIGKDTIPSIDRPEYVPPDDPRLASRGVTLETEVLGVEIDGIARAYPVAVMDMHEVVNDDFGGKAFAVLW